MRKIVISILFLLCSVMSAYASDWVEGTWQYYQTDGSTWLFDVTAEKNGPYFEFRVSRWNPSVYGNLEYGRVVSRLKYDASRKQFVGDHYSVETGEYYDEVIVKVENKNKLVYRGKHKSGVNGQSLLKTESDARWVEGTWQYYQNDGSTWLFDVKVNKNGPFYEFRLTNWNPKVYRNLKHGLIVSRLKFNSQQNQFYGDHYSVENGGYYDEVVLSVNNQNNLSYRGRNKSGINGQSLKR